MLDGVSDSQPRGIRTRADRAASSGCSPQSSTTRPSTVVLRRSVAVCVCLFRVWPRSLETMLLVKAATVVNGTGRLSPLLAGGARGPGPKRIAHETRKPIRQMCIVRPLWGAPPIHGELLKLGIQISQATVARYMLHHRTLSRRPGARSCVTTHWVSLPSTCSSCRQQPFGSCS